MLIISNIKDEGIYNLDYFSQIKVVPLSADDGEIIFSLKMYGNGPSWLVGEWDDREKADAALNKIIRANHEGHREVYLDD